MEDNFAKLFYLRKHLNNYQNNPKQKMVRGFDYRNQKSTPFFLLSDF